MDHMLSKPLYVVRRRGVGEYDVVSLGPVVVSKGLKPMEAEALANALNEEQWKHVNEN